MALNSIEVLVPGTGEWIEVADANWSRVYLGELGNVEFTFADDVSDIPDMYDAPILLGYTSIHRSFADGKCFMRSSFDTTVTRIIGASSGGVTPPPQPAARTVYFGPVATNTPSTVDVTQLSTGTIRQSGDTFGIDAVVPDEEFLAIYVLTILDIDDIHADAFPNVNFIAQFTRTEDAQMINGFGYTSYFLENASGLSLTFDYTAEVA